MGSICKKILTKAAIEDVWSAIRDIGALHTRLVPGFVPIRALSLGRGLSHLATVWWCENRSSLWTTMPGELSGLQKVDLSHTTTHHSKPSPRTALRAWCGLLTSCLKRLPAISKQQWMQPSK